MKGGGKIELLKAELAKTLKGLPDGVQFQMIFFAGPAWTPGSSLKKGGSKVTVTLNGRDYKWKSEGGSPFNWMHDGRKQKVQWVRSTDQIKAEYAKAVQETKLTGGTTWDPPLEMAINMSPAPDLIVFLTDGANGTPENSMNSAENIA